MMPQGVEDMAFSGSLTTTTAYPLLLKHNYDRRFWPQ